MLQDMCQEGDIELMGEDSELVPQMVGRNQVLHVEDTQQEQRVGDIDQDICWVGEQTTKGHNIHQVGDADQVAQLQDIDQHASLTRDFQLVH